MIPFIRSPYNYDAAEVSEASGLKCMDPSLADQSQVQEVDINNIVRRFGMTGHLPENVQQPMYADFDEIVDRQTVLNRQIEAQQSYNALPEAVRKKCGKSYSDFLRFCDDPANDKAMIELGLAVAKPDLTKPEEPINT